MVVKTLFGNVKFSDTITAGWYYSALAALRKVAAIVSRLRTAVGQESGGQSWDYKWR